VLEKGYEVVMLDVGRERPRAIPPAYDFATLKTELDDPVEYLLGERFGAVTYPSDGSEYYGIPPSKDYIFAALPGFEARTTGFSALFSFARGGLAEAWTAGVYPFNEGELRDFPFAYADIAPHYAEVARRIGISGVDDDLARFMPVHDHLMEPLRLDRHSQLLLDRYRARKPVLNDGHRCWVGRSRIATLSRDAHGRGACAYCERCLWGCPTGALYTPSATLPRLREFPGFRYVPGAQVSHFTFDRRRRISAVTVQPTDGGAAYDVPVDTLVLAAGTLASSKIFLESVYRGTGEVLRLPGLMDNQQILMPFVNLGMLGKALDPSSYQYHQVCLGIEGEDPREYVHGQVTTLKTAMVHPVIQNLPFDLRTATTVFRQLRAALGIVNINLHDTRRADSYVTLEPGAGANGGAAPLLVHYTPPAGDAEAIRSASRRVARVLRALRCVVPPGMAHVRQKGASVHYSGTLPMSTQGGALTTTPECRSTDFQNLYFADGTTFPFLPAKNITFTLMANASRVASAAF
jgi:choline dehydrogenase-like flavoprotein